MYPFPNTLFVQKLELLSPKEKFLLSFTWIYCVFRKVTHFYTILRVPLNWDTKEIVVTVS